MKNKNLVVAMFILGIVLMSSIAFAGVTGYAITLKKAPVLDDNLGKASVTSVSRSGVATFEFANPETGRTEILSGTAGETLTTSSGTEVQISAVKSGGLFRKANAEISVVPAPTPSRGPAYLSGSTGTAPTCNGVYDDTLNTNAFTYWDKKNNLDYHKFISVTDNSGNHYFLRFKPREDPGNNQNETDVWNVATGQVIATDKVAGDVITIGNVQITIDPNSGVYVTATDKYVDLDISGGYFSDSCTEGGHTHLSDYIGEGIKTTGFIRNPNDPRNVYLTLTCPSGMIPIDGGFDLLFDSFNSQTQQLPTIQWDYHDLAAYYIAFYDAYDIININSSRAYIYCARIEPTLHQFGQDY